MVFVNGIEPVDPFHLILIEVNLKQCLEVTHFVWNLHWILLGFSQINRILLDDVFSKDKFLEESIKLLSSDFINAASNTPDGSVEKSVNHLVINIIWDLDVLLISKYLSVWLNIALDHSNDVVDNKGSVSWAWESTVYSCELDTEINDIMEVLLQFITGLILKDLL